MKETKPKQLQPVRGTHDLIGDDCARHRLIIDSCYRLATNFGYRPIETPIFEASQVFHRTLGDTSDIVGKETYTFLDRGGEEITLRPEATASVARALLSNGLLQYLPLKFIYHGPMFRYERPQKGRFRQFHQLGVECFGLSDPLADVECIALGVEILARLGIQGQLQINTLGDTESRQNYRTALVAFLQKYVKDLSEDSQLRLQKNPLRILDSKDPGDRKILEEAPLFDDYHTTDAKAFYNKIREGLDVLGIPAQHNPRLVRGLDYYCHTAFEIVHKELGAQSTLLAGGRYDGLITQMGGPATPGIGWALGIDRLALLLSGIPAQPRPIAIIPISEAEENFAMQLACQLRWQGWLVEFCYGQTVAKRFKQANKSNARLALILGPDELAAGQANIKDLDRGVQEIVSLDQLNAFLSTH